VPANGDAVITEQPSLPQEREGQVGSGLCREAELGFILSVMVMACEIRLNQCCTKCSCRVYSEGHYWCPAQFSESIKLPVLQHLLLFTSTLLLLKDHPESAKLSVSLHSLLPRSHLPPGTCGNAAADMSFHGKS